MCCSEMLSPKFVYLLARIYDIWKRMPARCAIVLVLIEGATLVHSDLWMNHRHGNNINKDLKISGRYHIIKTAYTVMLHFSQLKGQFMMMKKRGIYDGIKININALVESILK